MELVVLIDREYSEPMKEALGILKIEQPDREVLVVDVEDSEYEGEGSLIGSTTYDDFISQSDGVKMHGNMPADEWNAYAVNYTSGVLN
ncbi:hypothetical protein SARC_11985 [Sphaeroforma arctica JP610]|uniref:Uncharacterized protein n=1 Tax=Sphaeroforma arctica JP610 TaxID=667725 RepID=A0A0L0FGA6_9EUKA|nr:hypothetical protein SARC_11985 [Sphaeroforma arctica JP610]KNC75491.1 hypothetical protein SARC_11985 [Sphaeroforma arctica JP610]|eukprot:XP_014149393.1 hypothetical protein SARC_11985 [Sphaeroforma arctica JP610]